MSNLQAFISYSFNDKEIMNRLKNSLQSDGIKCYVAQHDEDYGNILSEKLENAIDESDVMIVILTQNSTSSSSVGSEIGYAKKAGKKIIPLVEYGVQLPVFLQGKENIGFTHDTFDEACHKISRFIKTKLSNEDDNVIEDDSTEETIVIESGNYHAYSYNLKYNQTLFGEINSDIPVNVYIVNDRNLRLMDAGKGFTSDYDTEKVKRCKINFHPTTSGTWNIVIENQEDDYEEYEDAEVDVFLDVR